MNSCRCRRLALPRAASRLRRAETGNSKYYRFTAKGRRQFLAEESHWKQMAEAVAHVMGPAAEET
jgi:DNA-binding PadR family transcriptional regulator